MARRSQCSSAGDNPLDPNYLPPHYREEYRLAIDALIEEDLEGYYQLLEKVDVVDFLSLPEIQYIQRSVQVPQQSSHPEQHFLETGVEGSSDTYWPIHSDLDAPGLDLGWPQLHHFIEPTEVTTLVNPPEPDMPSIKEQARRLIKNAQQVIAIVMDMFTDVDMFADVLNAAMRNVAVYILLDKQNAHHFVNMVSNCRVNLLSIQSLRVRTVSGITYHCRSGKSFKGQMMDRFLLTDCRAVLSGNYSFMWSFEKLHRCMAHLFLGQLVSTFDEEFRILFAQSQPLVIENVVAPMEDFSLLQKRQYTGEITSLYREPRTFLSVDTPHPEEWARHSYDERMDWRMMPLNRQESLQGPADMYNRFPSKQSCMDPSFDQGPSRMPMIENRAFNRHGYAEAISGRYPYPFLQKQGMPDPENQGRQFHRAQQPYPGPAPGKEADYSGYDMFWSQGDQNSEPGLPQEMEPHDNFDPVLNYLSSTRNVDFDQGSDKLPPAADLPFSSSHPRRLSLGQLYVCQTSPTPSNPTDQKQFFQEPNTVRKDPMVKQGLRNWRISSYLSAYDNQGDEGLLSAPPNEPDPFEKPSNIIQQTTPCIESVPKLPNVREFKVPAIPRASQMPSYAKTTAREHSKQLPDEPIAVAAETKTTPTPSESSSTTEGEKTREVEQKEPKTAVVQREESFRRKHNAAVPRSSRLRSSLIFSSLEQQHISQDTKTAQGQQDEESDKNEAEQTKLPFVSQVLGKKRSTAKEPFEWSRYIRSATDSSKPDDGNSKADDKDSSKDENVEQANSSPSMPQSKPSEAELPKSDQPAQPPKFLPTSSLYVDMSDPDMRLMFFKELAAKRKAVDAKKSKEKAPMKTPTEHTTVKNEEPVQKETSENMADTSTSEGLSEKNATAEDEGKTVSTDSSESVSLTLDGSDKTKKEGSQVKNDTNNSQSCKEEQTRVSSDSEKIELNNSQSAATLPVSAGTEAPQSKLPEEPKLSNPAVKKSSPSHPSKPTNATPANVPSLAQGTDESESQCLDSTSKHSSSLTPSPEDLGPSSAFAALDSNTQNPESVQLETSISSSPQLFEQHTGSEFNSSNPSVQSSSSDHILPDSGSQISPSPSPSSSASLSTPAETMFSIVTPEDSSSTLTSSILSPDAQASISPPPAEPSQSVKETSQKSTASSVSQTESTQDHLDSASQLTSPETPSAVDSAHVETDISPETYAADSEPDTSSLQSTTKTDSEESCAPTPSEKDAASENNSISKGVGGESEVLRSSKNVKPYSTPPSLSPSSPESCLPNISVLESKSRSDQNENITITPSPADPPPEHSLAERSSRVHPDINPNTSQEEPTASPQEALIQVTPPSELNLTGPVIPTPAEIVSCSSPLTESVGLVLSPEAEKTLSTLHSPSDKNSIPKLVTTDSNETPMLQSTETYSPTEPNSKVPPEPDLPCKTPESVTSETHPTEPPVPAENSQMDSQNEVSKEPEMSPEAEKTLSTLHSPSDKNSIPKLVTTDSNETPMLQSTETYSPTEPNSKVPPEPDLPCKTPESVTSETHPSEPPVPAENSQNEVSKEPEMPHPGENKTDDTEATNKVNIITKQESVCSEKTNDQVRQNNCSKLPETASDEVIAPSPQSKQPKSSQSRYHSSTANVLSSSNLRDDTKLLLEQISANSQSRNEATKESPVTDDEKEDKADKNAEREKEREIRSLSRGQPKSIQEREKLLERIQSMRKERKVYSRFEMAP